MSGEHEDTRSDRHPDMIITPAPDDDELAAIVVAVTTWSQAQAHSVAHAVPESGPSRWARAGRQEAMQGLARDGEQTAR